MRENERGAAMVEMAIVSLLGIVILIGMVDFGRGAYEAIRVENAAIAGAIYGAQSKEHAKDSGGIHAAALADLGDFPDKAGVAIASERYCECPVGTRVDCEKGTWLLSPCLPRTYVHVRLDKTFETLFPYPGIPHRIALRGETHVRVD